MYDAEKKLSYLNGKYKAQLQAIFNNSEEMEKRLGDIADWTTVDYAEYCALFRIFTNKSLSIFKSALKKDYLIPCGKSFDELKDLTLHLVYSKVQNLHIRVFWSDVDTLVRTLRNYSEDGLKERKIFTYNSIITASALLYCGVDFKDLSSIKRDDVVSKGIWSYDFPIKIQRQTVAASFIMYYAKCNPDLMEEYMLGLPLCRGGNIGRKPLSADSFRTLLSNINNVKNKNKKRYDYDITTQNIVLSGELTKAYSKIGNTKDYDPVILEPIIQREHVKIGNIIELQNLYTLYCMTID